MEFLINLLIVAVAIIIIGSLAYWVITKFFTGDLAQIQMPALAIVGLLLLIWVLGMATGYWPSPIKLR